MVRNAVWKIVRFIAFKQYERAAEALSEASESNEWTAERFAEALAPYWAEYDAIQIGPDARSSAQVQIERSDAEWKLTQILLDPDEHRSWHMRFRVDLAASREAAAPVLMLESLSS
jgi:hypothetical protein